MSRPRSASGSRLLERLESPDESYAPDAAALEYTVSPQCGSLICLARIQVVDPSELVSCSWAVRDRCAGSPGDAST